jgi:hypothetical protein
MFTFIHAADIHLDSPMHKLEAYDGAPVEEFRLSTRRAFENLVKQAVSREAAFVLISGDLYDGDWKDYNTGLYFIEQMTRLREAGIRVFITAGNHDAASTITRSLRMPDNVTLFPSGRCETVLLENPPAAIHGRSYASPAERSDLSVDYPPPIPGRFNIGMLHTCAAGRPGHEPYAPCSIDSLAAKGYHYWALGHVHTYEILCHDPPVVFPGNIQGRHIREPGARGAVQVAVDEDMRPSLSFVETDVVRWLCLNVDAGEASSGFDVVAAFAGRLEEALSEHEGLPLAVRVEVSGESPAAAELHAAPERWIGEIRAAAIETAGGRVWVEKVVFAAGLPRAASHPPEGGAVDELLQVFTEMEQDPGARAELSEVLSDFYQKLPRELKEEPDAIRFDDPEWVAGLLSEVRPELVGRLMKREADS